jgi:hypothetical protein
MDLFDYLKSATTSLFRWEALQEYQVEGEEDMSEWWDFIESKTRTGVVMQRVRLITLPLTNYTKREVNLHKLSAKRGDDIRYIFDTNQIDVHRFKDFWLIDEKILLSMQYSSSGTYEGFEIVEKGMQPFVDFKNKIYAASEPIEKFALQD